MVQESWADVYERGDTSLHIVYSGGDGANVVTASLSGIAATLTDSAGVTPGKGCRRSDPFDQTTVVCKLGNSKDETVEGPAGMAFEVSLGGGDDSFTFSDVPARPGVDDYGNGVAVDGGLGDDDLHTEQAGLLGSVLRGGLGDDQLFGGPGEDGFLEDASANGADTIAEGRQLASQTATLRRGLVVEDLLESVDGKLNAEGRKVLRKAEKRIAQIGVKLTTLLPEGMRAGTTAARLGNDIYPWWSSLSQSEGRR